MKTIFFAMLLLSTTAIFAQNGRNGNNPPTTVQQSFQRDNPNVNNGGWSRSNNHWRTNYRDNNNRNVDAYYDRNGVRMETHTTWINKDVPVGITNRINSGYRHHGNYTVSRIERHNSQPLFQIRIGRGRPLYMDEMGRRRQYYGHH